MSNYMNTLDGLTGTKRHVARAFEILGKKSTAIAKANPSSVTEFVQGLGATAPPDVTTSEYATLAGAGVGYFAGQRYGHPVLGVLAGASAGRNLPALLRPEERRLALCNMGVMAAALAASIYLRKTVFGEVGGFLAGYVGGSAVVHVAGLRR